MTTTTSSSLIGRLSDLELSRSGEGDYPIQLTLYFAPSFLLPDPDHDDNNYNNNDNPFPPSSGVEYLDEQANRAVVDGVCDCFGPSERPSLDARNENGLVPQSVRVSSDYLSWMI